MKVSQMVLINIITLLYTRFRGNIQNKASVRNFFAAKDPVLLNILDQFSDDEYATAVQLIRRLGAKP